MGMENRLSSDFFAVGNDIHTHVHLVPRYGAEDDLKIDFVAHEPDFDKLAQVAETIKNA